MENVLADEAVLESGYVSFSYPAANESVRKYLISELGKDIADGFHWLHTKDKEDIPGIGNDKSGIANTHLINDVRRVNKYFEKANSSIQNGQHLVVCMDTKNARKKRILNKYPKAISYPYYALDFILKRFFPKWKPTRKLYFGVTKGRNRVMSLTEVLGRLVCCGFEIVDYRHTTDRTIIIAKKIKPPAYDMQPTYGVLIRLNRVGYNGKKIHVYKLRTMHPYSEYLQEYVFEHNDLEEGGKFKNDFRTTSWGGFLRRHWIDELPMLLNFFKGEMKLIGVRPLSCQYFTLYPDDLKEMRIQVKPGLVPPYYADLPNSLDEILDSERKYLKAYREKPVRTDIRYFCKACKNILLGGARSK